MATLIYDGTFDGLMTVLHEVFSGGERGEDIVAGKDYQPNLFSPSRRIEADSEKAGLFIESIRKKISSRALRHTYYVCSSERKEAGAIIYHYLKKGFALGKEVDFHLLDPDVAAAHAVSKKVGRELHRLLGLTRFRLLDRGILYAPLEPDNDLIALLAPHFAIRLPRENWLIHDVGRKKAALYNKKQWVITAFYLKESLPLAEEEKELQDLWKTYFAKIAIEERRNPRLQAGNMPKKYWKYLVEKEPDTGKVR
jgi:probable DNA metabolism protein